MASASVPASAGDVISLRPGHRMWDPDRSAVGVEGGVGVLGRTFVYADRGTADLREYEALAIATPYVRFDVWPAFIPKKFPLDLGFVGGAGGSIGLRSTIDGARVPTRWTRWDLGVALRAHIPRGSARLGVSVGRDRFAFDASEVPSWQLPQTDYTYVRVGVDARIRLGFAAVVGALGYRFVPLGHRDGAALDTVSDRFPHATVGGVDAQLGIVLPLYGRSGIGLDRWLRGLEVRTTFEWTRWFYAMHPELGDAYVAGGALDHGFGVRFGFGWVF